MRRAHGRPDYVYAPPPTTPAPYPYYPHHGERIYTANVVAVRPVVGPPEQRCWVEQQQVSTVGAPNDPAAIGGALIGGVLGHQVGSGRGNDVATVGGAVAGAAVGSQVGRDGGQGGYRDVKRCESVPSQAAPAYWDVTYNFRGREHQVQMTSPPGNKVSVNEQGEPRA